MRIGAVTASPRARSSITGAQLRAEGRKRDFSFLLAVLTKNSHDGSFLLHFASSSNSDQSGAKGYKPACRQARALSLRQTTPRGQTKGNPPSLKLRAGRPGVSSGQWCLRVVAFAGVSLSGICILPSNPLFESPEAGRNRNEYPPVRELPNWRICFVPCPLQLPGRSPGRKKNP